MNIAPMPLLASEKSVKNYSMLLIFMGEERTGSQCTCVLLC